VSLELLPWEPPALGTAVDTAGDLRWIRLPVPGALQHINVWLAPGRARRVLIDTGMNQPDTHTAWEALTVSERLEQELEAILVTHHHPDHFGMAGHLARRFGVAVRMSEPARAAAQRATLTAAAPPEEPLAQYREAWGVDFAALLTRARGRGCVREARERHAKRCAPDPRGRTHRGAARSLAGVLALRARGRTCVSALARGESVHQRRSAAAEHLE
jgi:glyoxylase-like metal-dependent hydrolase (beta-lactamase superfamily II)